MIDGVKSATRVVQDFKEDFDIVVGMFLPSAQDFGHCLKRSMSQRPAGPGGFAVR